MTDTSAHEWNVPAGSGRFTTLRALPGLPIVIVGANGAGKSALATWLYQMCPTARRVIAHRKLWLSNEGPELSAGQRANAYRNQSSWDRSFDSRYIDSSDSQRSSIQLFDLIDASASEARRVIAMYDSGLSREEVRNAVPSRVFETLNDVFNEAGLYVRVDELPGQRLEVSHSTLEVRYPVNQMSDGERGALLLAAEILSAPSGSVFIVDEPERHLHPALSVGLVRALIRARSDCAFTILTHDLHLAAAHSSEAGVSYVLLGCRWSDSQASTWELNELPRGEEIPEAVRLAVLGGRRKVLFVEGEPGSIDTRLYTALFPGWTVHAAGGCEQVIRAVSGVRASASLNWISAAGIVDRDGRTDEQIAGLAKSRILVLKVSEVESLLYSLEVVTEVAASQQVMFRDEPGLLETMVADATIQGRNALSEEFVDRAARGLARQRAVHELVSAMPLELGEDETVRLTVANDFSKIKTQLLRDRDGSLSDMVRLMPIRDTGFRIAIARALRFQRIEHYESVAIGLLKSSPSLREWALESIDHAVLS